MPEGPEIKRAADSLVAALVGKRALLVEFAFPSLYQHARALTGKTILDVTPRGKAMLTQFEGGKTIFSHNENQRARLHPKTWRRVTRKGHHRGRRPVAHHKAAIRQKAARRAIA
jgi:formamidopyrimidine-DNA glycosylase